MSYNNWVVNARLTRPVKMHESANGKEFCNVGIAWNTGWGDKKKSSFMDCVAFGNKAKFIAANFDKGDGIILSGSIELDTWEKEGVRKSKHQLVINDATFAEGKKDNEITASVDQPQYEAPKEVSDIPF